MHKSSLNRPASTKLKPNQLKFKPKSKHHSTLVTQKHSKTQKLTSSQNLITHTSSRLIFTSRSHTSSSSISTPSSTSPFSSNNLINTHHISAHQSPLSTSKRHWGWAQDHKWPVQWPKKRVKEVYAGWKPPEFSKENCFFRVAKNGQELGVIEFRLFDSVVPKTAHNFRQLCLGTRKVLDMPLHFRGTRFHRVIKRFMIQGGDITNNDGTGGASVYGRHFPDESFMLLHDRPFLLASANRGPNTNNSGFYITTTPAPWLDGRNVVFGEVVYGQDVVREIEHTATNAMDTPMETITILDCGVVNTSV